MRTPRSLIWLCAPAERASCVSTPPLLWSVLRPVVTRRCVCADAAQERQGWRGSGAAALHPQGRQHCRPVPGKMRLNAHAHVPADLQSIMAGVPRHRQRRRRPSQRGHLGVLGRRLRGCLCRLSQLLLRQLSVVRWDVLAEGQRRRAAALCRDSVPGLQQGEAAAGEQVRAHGRPAVR